MLMMANATAVQNRAITYKLLGFVGEDVHAYRLLKCTTGRVITRYSVTFDESSVIHSSGSGTALTFDFDSPQQ